jgi:hypothetical protein
LVCQHQKKADWRSAQEAANCEANGTCCKRLRTAGQVYLQLARQAQLPHRDYASAQARLKQLDSERKAILAACKDSPRAIEGVGLLANMEVYISKRCPPPPP